MKYFLSIQFISKTATKISNVMFKLLAKHSLKLLQLDNRKES